LFNEYSNELSEWIGLLEACILMALIKIDIIQYADDITSVANTASGLHSQIDRFNEYGEEYGIQFNPDKTTIVVFNVSVKRSVEDISGY
jgi:hypothetical protein